MILDVNKIQEGECLAWVSSPVRTLAVWTSFNKAVKTIKQNNKTTGPIYIRSLSKLEIHEVCSV
jgi:hypothetical protein